MLSTASTGRHTRGFTMTEILVVIGTIIVLLGILLPALSMVRTQAGMAGSESNLKQVATWMRMYSTDNREHIVPTQFNYGFNPYPGHVRSFSGSVMPTLGDRHMGTWTDILWTVYGNFSFPQLIDVVGHDYSTDSPDMNFYGFLSDHSGNPFRSEAPNRRVPSGGNGALPFGNGIFDEERGMPGYFAGNNFFNTDSTSPTVNGWFVTGQIKSPSRSVYAVDSFYGETIEARPDMWNVVDEIAEVDFRYADSCIMLMLDGSVQPVGPWEDLDQLETERRILVRDLDK